MAKPNQNDHQFRFATALLRAFFGCGGQHVLISPGSRSTPLTLAAAAFPALLKNVILDERSAAFTALGIGKATARPAALICTSGTAVANYLPAVIEAKKSGVPLLLYTADRPACLHGTGSNQTIEQHHIFDHFAVHTQTLSADDYTNNKTAADHFSRLMLRSTERKGPVHLNIQLQKPLEPSVQTLATIRRENEQLREPEKPLFAKKEWDESARAFSFPEGLQNQLTKATRPLIIVGQLAPASPLEPIATLAKKLGCPLLSEHGQGAHGWAIQGFDGFLRNAANAAALEPDFILRFGREPASKSLLNAITQWRGTPHIHLADLDEPSTINDTTTASLRWNGQSIEAKAPGIADQWLRDWKAAEDSFFQYSQQVISGELRLHDLQVYHHIIPQIPESWGVFYSNSLPARDRSLVGRWKNQPVFTNRGVSGIDGISSTALGVQLGSHQPAILFTGDLAFLHDTNALLNMRQASRPLVIVIINNSGGSIFRMLPVVEHGDYFESYFETPQQVSMQALAEAYGLAFSQITDQHALQSFDLNQSVHQASTNVKIIECRTHADTSMAVRESLWNFSFED